MLQQIPLFTLVPRFILSLRELYARDLQGRSGSRSNTAFSLKPGSGNDATIITIAFARVEDEEDVDGIEMRGGDRDIHRTSSNA